ncbi:MAG: hypothetical protein HXN47_03160 [Prevotella nanceiensis]|nr:hypothetical protein [Hoylesella nanceiensis]
MKKLTSLWLFALCLVSSLSLFSSCSDDNNGMEEWRKDSKVDLPSYRGFVLSEGSFGGNNSHLYFFNPQTDTIFNADIYETQNKQKLGDTANDMITYDGDIYVVVNNSKRLLRLSGAGLQLAAFEKFNTIGAPRKVVAVNNKLYVTCYGGYVARFDAKTLTLEDSVKVGANPEQIIESKGKLYCVNSGYGEGNTLSVIDIQQFKTSTTHTAPYNPTSIVAAGNYTYITALYHTANWSTYYGQVYSYDLNNFKYQLIAQVDKVLAVDNLLYMVKNKSAAISQDINSFAIYNSDTKQTSTWNLKNVPTELYSNTVYMVTRNSLDGSFYIGTTDYVSNGVVYHFDKNGTYINKFSAGGINPNAIVFLK